MLGIRNTIKDLDPSQISKGITDKDFEMKGCYELPSKRVKNFDKTKACKFNHYAPLIFEKIRLNFGISNQRYMNSVGPEQLLQNLILGNLSTLTEKSSSGKSGSFFYYTQDD